jgi:hypothetical protein
MSLFIVRHPHAADPLNCETSLAALIGGVVLPNARFYMRNNFRMPNLVSGCRRWRGG